MHFSTIFVSATAFATGAFAAAIRDTGVASFRTYGENGCSADNLGVSNIPDTDTNACNPFDLDLVKSLVLTSINDGCELTLYTDDECNASYTTAQTYYCTEAYGQWKRWKVVC